MRRDIFVIQVAAGEGKRWKASLPQGVNKKKRKPFFSLGDKPILVWSLLIFENNPYVDKIYLVLNKKDIRRGEELVSSYKLSKVKKILEGGESRQHSVYNALRVWDKQEEFVMIHDGVRPFVTHNMIIKLREALIKNEGYVGAILYLLPKDTVKYIKNNREVVKTLERKNLILAQTPQIFRKSPILQAYSKLEYRLKDFSDDSSIVELFGKVLILEGEEKNIKITTYNDLLYADSLIRWSANSQI